MSHWSREFREWSAAWCLDPPPAAVPCYAIAAAVVLPLLWLFRALDIRE